MLLTGTHILRKYTSYPVNLLTIDILPNTYEMRKAGDLISGMVASGQATTKPIGALPPRQEPVKRPELADVTLKERRRLVLVVRETPLHIGHIKLMERASEMGAVIFPPVPAFYHKPKTIDDLINHTIGKILDLFDIKHTLFARWQGSKSVK